MFPYNIGASIVFSLFSVYVIYECSIFPKPEPGAMGPAYWPAFLGWALLIFSLGLLAETLAKRSVARRRAHSAGESVEEEPSPFDFKSLGMKYVYALCGIFLVFSVLLHYFKFTVASVVLIPACMRLLGEKRLWMIAAVTVGLPLVIYIIFARILNIVLP